MAIALRKAVEAIADRRHFKAGANTLTALTNEEGDYLIYSYRALIARINRDGSTWITSDKYSVTTSRHTGIARRGIYLFWERGEADTNNHKEAH